MGATDATDSTVATPTTGAAGSTLTGAPASPSVPYATPTGAAVAWDHGERKSGADLSGAMSSDASTTDPTVEPVVSIAVASEVITLDWKKRSVEMKTGNISTYHIQGFEKFINS